MINNLYCDQSLDHFIKVIIVIKREIKRKPKFCTEFLYFFNCKCLLTFLSIMRHSLNRNHQINNEQSNGKLVKVMTPNTYMNVNVRHVSFRLKFSLVA